MKGTSSLTKEHKKYTSPITNVKSATRISIDITAQDKKNKILQAMGLTATGKKAPTIIVSSDTPMKSSIVTGHSASSGRKDSLSKFGLKLQDLKSDLKHRSIGSEDVEESCKS